MRVIDYKILTESTEYGLAGVVRNYLVKGWEPQGGVAYTTQRGAYSDVYLQAVVKYSEEDQPQMETVL